VDGLSKPVLLLLYVAETMKGFRTDFPSNQYFSPEARPTEQDFPSDGFSDHDFFADLLQQRMASVFTELNRTSASGPPQWAPPLKEPECAFCHSKTSDLKRCLGCKKVFYCGKKCQTQDWKKHKSNCQAYT